jgi:hypothetical protein
MDEERNGKFEEGWIKVHISVDDQGKQAYWDKGDR